MPGANMSSGIRSKFRGRYERLKYILEPSIA